MPAEFQSSRLSQPLPSMMGRDHSLSPAQQDMEALKRSTARLVRGVLLLAFAALAAAYVWHAWLR